MPLKCVETGVPFDVANEDLSLLEKVAPRIDGQILKIPLPTRCPGARERRRLAWRNERSFYRSKCALSGQPIVSIYAPSSPYVVYSLENWFSDKWDATIYGRDFDFSRSFADQFKELLSVTPLIPVLIGHCENSDYTNYSLSNKDSYMLAAADYNEACFHSSYLFRSKDCGDCLFVSDSELCYECIDCTNCYETFASQFLKHCNFCLFCYDCRSCNNCIGCSGLRHKDYHVFNEPVSKDDFESLKKELLTSWYSRFAAMIKRNLEAPRTHAVQENCERSEGTGLVNCKNCNESHDLIESEDCKYVRYGIKARDCLDVNGIPDGELLYECTATPECQRSAFCASCWDGSSELFYSYLLRACQNCFGCVSLHRKQYCILNKEYSKGEYFRLLPKIIEHMIDGGEWGEFFPVGASPFAYNETAAMDAFPLPSSEVQANGWLWRDIEKERGDHEIKQLSLASDFTPNDDNVPKVVFECQETKKPYRIVKPEVQFYQKLGVPLPTLHPDVRHQHRIKVRQEFGEFTT